MKIQDIIEDLASIEEKCNIQNESFWDISYNYVDAVYNWASGGGFVESMDMIGGNIVSTGGGSFIKHLLKVS